MQTAHGERLEETGEGGRGGGEEHRTAAATYVENRVTNHKRVYGGASDHWPQRIIDGYGRCRVSIRRTIEMKGCTRTVKADLVAIPRRADERSGAERHGRDCYPPRCRTNPLTPLLFTSQPTPPCPPAWDAIRLRSAIRADRPSLSVSNHLLFSPRSRIFYFFSSSSSPSSL